MGEGAEEAAIVVIGRLRTCLRTFHHWSQPVTAPLTLIAVAAYAWITYGQWDTLEKTLHAGQQQFRISQQTQVSVTWVQKVAFEVGKAPRVVVHFRNTGLTPARDLGIGANLQLTDQPIPPPVFEDNVRQRCLPFRMGQTPPPGIERSVDSKRVLTRGQQMADTQFLTQDDVDAVRFRKTPKWWHIMVYLHYRDDFGWCHVAVEPFIYDVQFDEVVPSWLGAAYRADYDEGRSGNPPKPHTTQGVDDINRQIATYTFWLVLFTAALVLATAMLAFPAISQARISRDTARRQLRAYVVVEDGTIGNVMNPPAGVHQPNPNPAAINLPAVGPIAILFTENSGQTPALNVATWANICLRESPLVADLIESPVGAPGPRSILGPGMKSVQRRGIVQLLTPQDIGHLVAGTGAIYVYGHITYTDVFGKPHISRFRLMQNGITGQLGVDTTLYFCEEGNDAD